MKYLLLLAVVMGMVWWIKLSRRVASPDKPAPPANPPQNMVRCAYCGLHLPENEAVVSGKASYCSQAHLSLADTQT